jgi:Cysteine rich repeat
VQRLALSLVCLATGVAYGQQDVCGADVEKFCANTKVGAGRVSRCLEDHEPQLSPGCQTKVETNKQKAKALIVEFDEACQADVAQLCPGVAPGGGRLLKCLTKNDYALTRGCLAEVNKIETAKAQVLNVRQLCEGDVKRLCPSTGSHAGEFLTCLEASQAQLSPECKAANPGVAIQSAELLDLVEEVTSQARLQDTIEILQGLNSVAFSRSSVALQFDYLQGIAGQPANADELTFNPTFVFGHKNEFAVELKVPVAALFPTPSTNPSVPTRPAGTGIADVNTAFGWAFYAHGAVRQYLALALQWNSATLASVGAPWVVAPVYAIAAGLASWFSLTVEVTYNHSFGTLGAYPGVNLAVLRPILVFNLPSTTFLALDTKLGWDFTKEQFVPVMKFQGGKIFGRERNVSIAAWYQVALNTVGQKDSFKYGVGFSLSYFFDW